MFKKSSLINTITVILKAMWYLQCLSVAVYIAFFVLLLVNPDNINIDKFTGFGIEFKQIDLGSQTLNDGASHAIMLTNGHGRLHIAGHKQGIVLIKVIVAIIEVLSYIYIFHLLIKIFSGLSKGNFFEQRNGLIIKRIAFVIIAVTAFVELAQFFISDYVLRNYEINSMQLQRDTEIDFKSLFFGLMLLVISIVFIRGAKLREEQELTI